MKAKQNLIQIWLFCCVMLPAVVQAQFTITTNNGTITITGYAGNPITLIIPSTTNGLPVANIGGFAFYGCTNLTSITMGTNLVSIGQAAFYGCSSLTSVTIPDSITSIGSSAFEYCQRLTNVTFDINVTNIGNSAFTYCSLTSVTIPNSVVNIEGFTFYGCTSLTSVTMGANVSSVGQAAFYSCSSLTSVNFQGNTPTPTNDITVFSYDNNATVYYLPGSTGWGTTFDGRPTALWYLPNPMILNCEPKFGVRTNRFGFTISWATNTSVVVEACTNLVQKSWFPAATNTLTRGTSYFSDPRWTNYPGRFYRLRSL
jgi:hypothetical protein